MESPLKGSPLKLSPHLELTKVSGLGVDQVFASNNIIVQGLLNVSMMGGVRVPRLTRSHVNKGDLRLLGVLDLLPSRFSDGEARHGPRKGQRYVQLWVRNNDGMTSWGPVLRVHALKGQLIHCESLISQLIGIDKMGGHCRNIQTFMEDEDVGPESGGGIICNSSCDNIDVLDAAQLLLKSTNRDSPASLLEDLGTTSNSASVRMESNSTSMCSLIGVRGVSRVQ